MTKAELTDRERLIKMARFVNELLDAQQAFFKAPVGPQRQNWLKTCKALEKRARELTAYVLKDAPPEPQGQPALDIDATEPAPQGQNAQLI